MNNLSVVKIYSNCCIRGIKASDGIIIILGTKSNSTSFYLPLLDYIPIRQVINQW